jgi:hypothetical protein
MNDIHSESTPTPTETPTATLESLAEAHRSLVAAFRLALVSLLVLALSLIAFFYWEYRIARREIDVMSRIVTDYDKNTAPGLEDFRRKLQEFAQQNPDFRPLYIKYFGTNAPAGQSPGSNTASPARLPPPPGR